MSPIRWPWRRDRSAELVAAERLSAKRLKLLDVQAREIERLTRLNAELAAMLLEHRDCQRPELTSERVAGVLMGQEA